MWEEKRGNQMEFQGMDTKNLGQERERMVVTDRDCTQDKCYDLTRYKEREAKKGRSKIEERLSERERERKKPIEGMSCKAHINRKG